MDMMQKKILGVGVVAVVMMGSVAFMMFGRDRNVIDPSSVRSMGNTLQQSGASVDDPYYKAQLDKFNQQQGELAKVSGRTSVALMNPAEAKQEPKEEKRAAVERTEPVRTSQFDDMAMQNKLKFFEMLKGMEKGGAPTIATIESKHREQPQIAQAGEGGVPAGQGAGHDKRSIISGGSSLIATLDQELDTDIKGVDVFATVRTGDFEGAQFKGTISRQANFIRAPFTTMYWKGKTYTVNAVGMDPETNRAVLSGDVDNRWMERFGWPFVVAVVGGAGEVAARPTSSVQVASGGSVAVSSASATGSQILGKGISSGAQALSQGLQAEGRVEKVVRRPADAIIIRILSDVKEQ